MVYELNKAIISLQKSERRHSANKSEVLRDEKKLQTKSAAVATLITLCNKLKSNLWLENAD